MEQASGPVFPKQSGPPLQKNGTGPVRDPPDKPQRIALTASQTRHRLPQFDECFAKIKGRNLTSH